MKLIKKSIYNISKIVLVLFLLNSVIDTGYFISDYRRNEYSFSISGFHFNKEAVFVKGDKKIVLIGMTHVANKSFYENIKTRFKDTNAITLAEGVSDVKGSLEGFGYSTMAKLIGLSSQPKATKMFPNVKNADVDVSDIKKSEIESISGLFKNINQIDAAIAYPKEKPYQKFILDMRTDPSFNFRKSEVLLSRNAHLIKRIDQELNISSEIIIPWGALHLDEISSDLEAKGFQQQSVRLNYTHSTIFVGFNAIKWLGYLYFKTNIGFDVIN